MLRWRSQARQRGERVGGCLAQSMNGSGSPKKTQACATSSEGSALVLLAQQDETDVSRAGADEGFAGEGATRSAKEGAKEGEAHRV